VDHTESNKTLSEICKHVNLEKLQLIKRELCFSNYLFKISLTEKTAVLSQIDHMKMQFSIRQYR
jgi:hypothetical protein